MKFLSSVVCASHNGKNKIPNLIDSIKKIHYYQMKLLSAGLAKKIYLNWIK